MQAEETLPSDLLCLRHTTKQEIASLAQKCGQEYEALLPSFLSQQSK